MIKLKITGMSCGHCTSAVKNALQETEGVEKVVDVDLETGIAVIEGSTDHQVLINVIKEEGYQVEVEN